MKQNYLECLRIASGIVASGKLQPEKLIETADAMFKRVEEVKEDRPN